MAYLNPRPFTGAVVLVSAWCTGLLIAAGPAPPVQTPPPPGQQTGSQTTQTQSPPAAQGAKPPAPAAPPARQTSPEQQAYNEANRLTDPAKKLAAYEKIVIDYPTSDFLRQVQSSILYTLLDLPDRKADLGPAFDQVVANIPKDSTPEARLSFLMSPVVRLLDRDVVIDQAEPVLAEAVAALDFERFAKAERDSAARAKRSEPTKASLESRFSSTRASALEALARLHLAKGDDERAVGEFKEALALNPALSVAPVALAEMEAKRGNDQAALDYYLAAAAGSKLKKGSDEAFRALFKKVHGSDDGIEDELDRVFRESYPNPVHAEPWTATPARSGRMVLAELFTGSGCAPCVAADYALEAAVERYPTSVMATLVYHVHIPQPDPMTTPGSSARKVYYEVKGVPTFNVDGRLSRLGGGPRDNSKEAYDNYVKDIDKALETPAGATLGVQAAVSESRVWVSTTISNVAAEAKDLRLHVALAERELRFGGENGMRFHPFVVRALAGAPVAGRPVAIDATNTPTTEYAYGLPVTLDAQGRTTLDYSFDVTLLPAEITRSLDDELAKRRRSETVGGTSREYKAEGHAMTRVDPAALVVVVFLQDGAKHVLQAARVELAPAVSSGGR